MISDHPVTVETQSPVNGVSLARAGGYFNRSAGDVIRTTLADACGADWASRGVILDFANVTFIDSAGISALLSVREEVLGRGGKIVLCSVPPLIRRTFEFVGIERLIPLAASPRKAGEMMNP